MKDLKILVSSEAESKESQELFFRLGYGWKSGWAKYLNCSINAFYILARKNGEMSYCDVSEVEFNSKNSGYSFFKTITIQELRDMVNPMKEYLEKQADSSYKLVMRGVVKKDDDIEVPEISQFAVLNGDDEIDFYDGNGLEKSHFISSAIIWQRHTQPEELPFMDSLPEFKHSFGASSLNDQYAEIEQVRKQTIEATLAERQAQYGCFEDVARTTGKIMEALAEVRVGGLDELPYPHRMALYMIASKMARIVNGDYNHKDSWHDIGGYSKLIEDLL